MTFTRALGTNNYGPAKFIVDGTTTANGTHSTIAAALNVASSGDTIFIRPGTYTENLTLKAGVNLTAFTCDAFTPNVTISGQATYTGTGRVTCSGIRFQTNSDNCIEVSGNNASVLLLVECFINCSNNTGISFTSSHANSEISLNSCYGNIATTGISLFSMNSSGDLILDKCTIYNTGLATTASTCAGGSLIILNCPTIQFPISTSGSSTFVASHTRFDCFAINQVNLVAAASEDAKALHCTFISDSSAVITATDNLEMQNCTVQTSSATPITGAGTLTYGLISFADATAAISTTTQSLTRTIPGAGYQFRQSSESGSPSDSTTYYMATGGSFTSFTSSNGATRIYFSSPGVIKKCYGTITVGGTLASAQNVTVAIRKNDSSNTNITTTLQLTAADNEFSSTALNISVAEGDFIEFLVVTPAWVTNPTTVRFSATAYAI